MEVFLDNQTNVPIYQQMAEQIAEKISSGELEPGTKLPAVRVMAAVNKVAPGTVKLAYDTLARMGLVEKAQGSGTYVLDQSTGTAAGKKEQALEAIDNMFDELQRLGFREKDIRIFLDLKLREREHSGKAVKVGIVDCSPEARSVIMDQVSAISHAEPYEYDLDRVLESEQFFNPDMDLIVTTRTHVDQVRDKLAPEKKLIPVVMSVTPKTILELARIPQGTKVGVLCASRRFASIILEACEMYGIDTSEVTVSYFNEKDKTDMLLEQVDTLILPSNYYKLSVWQEQTVLQKFLKQHLYIEYRYQIDKGSLLHLQDELELLYSKMQ